MSIYKNSQGRTLDHSQRCRSIAFMVFSGVPFPSRKKLGAGLTVFCEVCDKQFEKSSWNATTKCCSDRCRKTRFYTNHFAFFEGRLSAAELKTHFELSWLVRQEIKEKYGSLNCFDRSHGFPVGFVSNNTILEMGKTRSQQVNLSTIAALLEVSLSQKFVTHPGEPNDPLPPESDGSSGARHFSEGVPS